MSDQTTRILDDSAVPPDARRAQASLVLIYGSELGRRYRVETPMEIGRSAANQVVIEADSVSRRHARLTALDGGYSVEDLGSTNGTIVNGDRIAGRRRLEHGDLVKIGGVVLRFISGDDLEARYHEEIYRMTIVDGLTQVHNRRYFDEFLERELSRCSRSGASLAVVLFDIDRFKDINDSLGHLFGDRLLREIARTVDRRVRREQLLARFGGDEFGIILPDTGLADALTLAERIRVDVSSAVIRDRDREARPTVSIGVAALEPQMTASALLKTVDESLYESKRGGRDRVSAIQAPPSASSDSAERLS